MNRVQSLFLDLINLHIPQYFPVFKRTLIIFVLLFVTIIMGQTFFIAPRYKANQSLQSQLQNMQQKTKTYNANQAQYLSQLQQKGESQSLLDEDMEDRINYVNKYFVLDGGQDGVRFTKIEFQDDVAIKQRDLRNFGKNNFVKSELTLLLTGSYKDISSYLHRIQSLPVLFNYAELNLSRPGNETNLVMELELHLYFFK